MAHSNGAKFGNRVAHVVSQTIVVTHSKLLHVKHKLAMMVFHSISDMISGEVHRSLDQVFQSIYEQLPQDSQARPLIDFMAHETGQLQAGAGMSMVSGSILGSIAQILNNELSPSVRQALESNPNMLPDTGTIAQLAAKGIMGNATAVTYIQQQGINLDMAKQLIEANHAYPDPSAGLDMLRRNLITMDTFLQWCRENAIPDDVASLWADTRFIPLSPADAALAVLRGNMPLDQALTVAQQWGMLESDFQVLIDNTGEPPGPEQLLEANRRGFIDQARLEKGILESRIRDEWMDVMLKLAYAPMSTADAVNAVIQSHLTQAEGEAIATQNGLEPGSFATLVDTAGAPLSRTEMEQLYNRGKVTKAQVYQALDESRLKPKYNDLAFQLHDRLLEPRELADMVMWGSMTHADAVARAMELGYDATSAAALIDASINRKLQSDRNTVVSSIELLYEDNAISEGDAQSQIERMGFSPQETAFKLQAAELKRHTKLVNAGLNVIRSKFVGRHIDKPEASSAIDAMGIPHQQRDALLQTWQLERDANVAQLTEAQIIKALKLQTITADDALARLEAKGYSAGDAAILIQDM